MKSSRELLPNTLRLNQNEISVYSGELTPRCAINQVVRLQAAFPRLPASMHDLIIERAKIHGFSDQRLKIGRAHV